MDRVTYNKSDGNFYAFTITDQIVIFLTLLKISA